MDFVSVVVYLSLDQYLPFWLAFVTTMKSIYRQ